jgi:hypothetical protein
MTRAQKLAAFQDCLSKVPGLKTGSELEESQPTARLNFDHPHGYRDCWRIIGPSSVPGFYNVVSTFRLDAYTQSNVRATFHLCLHESEFTRIH